MLCTDEKMTLTLVRLAAAAKQYTKAWVISRSGRKKKRRSRQRRVTM